MDVRIYRPAKAATQSGGAKTRDWVLEFEPSARREIDPLMGWTGSPDTKRQVRLRFESKAEAIAFAESHGLSYRVTEPQKRRPKAKSYAANFSYRRAV
jgi:hypothetical protein